MLDLLLLYTVQHNQINRKTDFCDKHPQGHSINPATWLWNWIKGRIILILGIRLDYWPDLRPYLPQQKGLCWKDRVNNYLKDKYGLIIRLIFYNQMICSFNHHDDRVLYVNDQCPLRKMTLKGCFNNQLHLGVGMLQKKRIIR